MTGKLGTLPVDIDGLQLGGDHPIRLQSMTDADTRDVKATVGQCMRAFEAGADLMRISVPDNASVQALKSIKKSLHNDGFHQPLVADIHFRPGLAMAAAALVQKIRINPGNFITPSIKNTAELLTKEQHLELLHDALKPLVNACREHGTAIRIGTNAGSLPHHVTYRYGHTPAAMAQATSEYIAVFEALGFNKLVISLKASNPGLMIEAYRLMAGRMAENNRHYPMHLGVTEAGEGLSGRTRSALGIVTLLQDGIGDTIRVSLTEPPENEILFGKKIIEHVNRFHEKDQEKLRKSQEKLRKSNESKKASIKKLVDEGLIARKTYDEPDAERLIISLASDFGNALLQKKLHGLWISAPNLADKELATKLCLELLQASGRHHSSTEFIACPGCARASINMASLLQKLKMKVPDFPGLRIAVMGCVVNGPGEMAGADYGLLGTSRGKVHIYEGTKAIKKHLDPLIATELLSDIIIEKKRSTKS